MSPPPNINGFSIVFSDSFQGPAHTLPDSNNNWNIIQSGPNRGNNEVQTYTNSVHNVQLSGGSTLQIMPQKDGNGNWTSGRLEGIHKFSCQAGQKMILQANLRTGRNPVLQQSVRKPEYRDSFFPRSSSRASSCSKNCVVSTQLPDLTVTRRCLICD